MLLQRLSSICALAIALVVSALLLAQGCTGEKSSTTIENPPASDTTSTSATDKVQALVVTSGAAPGYVGQNACYDCHAEITTNHRQTAMGKSFFKLTMGNIVEELDSQYYHEPSDRYYEVTNRDNEFFIKRYLLDDNGERFGEFEQRIDYVFGSGNNSRGYVYLNTAGEMFQMPIAWYSLEKKWGMAPGFDATQHDDFSRPITRNCMFCHNAYPDVPTGSDHYGQPNRFPTDLPQGIDCGRCHGPGAEHVRVTSDQSSTLSQMRDSIINPAKLDSKLQLDVCLQCHLEVTSKQTSIVGRFGKPSYAFEPGEPVYEYMVHFDHGTEQQTDSRFQIGSAAYRLLESTCFKSSNGQMTCSSCHDPHSHVSESERASFYRPQCFKCHEIDACSKVMSPNHNDPRVDANDCIACHMPQRRAQDVVHVVMTDHKIQRYEPQRDLLEAMAETPPPENAQVSFLFPDRVPSGPIRDVFLAIPDVRDGVEGSIDQLREAIAKAKPEAIEPYIELGAAELALGDFESASSTFEKVLDKDPNIAMAHTNRGTALVALGNVQEAIVHLRRAVELDPKSPDAHYNLAVVISRVGNEDEAIKLYQQALILRPNYAKCHFNLGNLFARAQQYEQAIVHYRRALAIDPDYSVAYRNLGKALRYQGKTNETLVVWRRGIMRRPQNSQMACDLAEALLASEESDASNISEALEVAILAVQADRRNARFVRAAALALVLNGDHTQGLEAAKQAIQLGADKHVCMLIAAVAMKQLDHAETQTIYDSASRGIQQDGSTDPLQHTVLKLAEELFGASRD